MHEYDVGSLVLALQSNDTSKVNNALDWIEHYPTGDVRVQEAIRQLFSDTRIISMYILNDRLHYGDIAWAAGSALATELAYLGKIEQVEVPNTFPPIWAKQINERADREDIRESRKDSKGDTINLLEVLDRKGKIKRRPYFFDTRLSWFELRREKLQQARHKGYRKRDEAFKRVQNLNFEVQSSEEKADLDDSIALMKEFLRRMLLWAKHLKLEDKWPWIDIAQASNSGLQLEDYKQKAIEATNYPVWVKITLIWYLRYVQHQTELEAKPELPEPYQSFASWEPKTSSINLPDPFEPLMLMYQQQVFFEREGNIIDLYDNSKKIAGFTLIRKVFDTEEAFVELE